LGRVRTRCRTITREIHLVSHAHKLRDYKFCLLDMYVEIVMLEKLDCILSKSATRPYIYEYKCECVRTHLCIDPSGRQQSPVIRESSPAIR
jgi:hypothetical protein